MVVTPTFGLAPVSGATVEFTEAEVTSLAAEVAELPGAQRVSSLVASLKRSLSTRAPFTVEL